MPPRLPTRAFAALPATSSSHPSSSAHPPPRSSPDFHSRSFRSWTTCSGASSHTHYSSLSPQIQSQRRTFHWTPPQRASAGDLYATLGVGKTASSSEIKKAYYSLAKKWHPDSSKEAGAKERFHEIQNAYDILSDDKKRRAYDQYGSAATQEGFDPDAFARGGAGGFGGFQGFGGPGGQAGNVGDIFESIFGAFGGSSRGQSSRVMRGDDLQASITLSFLEACNGATRKVTVTPVVDCKTCHGSGLKAGQKKTQCSSCHGTGQRTFSMQGMVMASTCPSCGGEGTTIPKGASCGDCGGMGRIKERKDVDVDIPAGIDDGMQMRIPGAGDTPLSGSGPPGDLLVRVNIKPSAVFRRQGTNLYHDAKVPLHVAVLGGKVRIPTLEGDVEVRVREGTQSGEEAVLRGRGIRNIMRSGAGSDRGDLVVCWRIQVPRSLSPFQKKLWQAYADDEEGKPTNVSFDTPIQVPPPSDDPSSGRYTPPTPPPPAVEPETSQERGDENSVTGSVASAVGGAVGWLEKWLGRGKEGR
ncbi:hypothetical protein TREMEDRAFT_25144 [Tremella mesenterica DSM 1558]|uniref:uncharacterized protein n=1 Tax=Tremella mesenterica (strain ATCC 24925 / CBS 8224 / DSM 1558 / NBRC 9311 / NRRL Y-6157 / RJB 2259-6 / UBC 559-6) TaxID=578456 RepID=UPI0003F48FCB|nr:uncharacterized protein TREMEDRAFT_25144 [Tremella mesenterica DSM 1558]EIW72456.1 hypothetical protein TREMEDRAFT_25144 [Tremella mesenterica DSM 1558]